MKKKANHPQWALAQKKPGTEIRCIRGKYYLYECSSFYDKELKKTRKKTGRYLGTIVEGRGLVPPRRKQVEIENEEVSAKAAEGQACAPEPKVGQVQEYGLSAFITEHCRGLIANLKSALPGSWNRVLAMAYCRLRNQSPLKHVKDDFADSWLSHELGTEGLSARTLTDFMKSLGKDRQGMLSFVRKYARAGGNVILDGTDLLSASAKMDFPRMSKTKLGGFAEAVNLMMAFSTGMMLPVYYRLLPGNVKDVTSFLTSIDEFGDSGMTAVCDKGFYSRNNVGELYRRGLKFLIAMRRSTSGLDYDKLYRHNAEGHFFYAERLIKYTSQTLEGHTVYLYHDAKHAAEEEADYLRRVDSGKYEDHTMETYKNKAPQFGTLAVMVSAGMNAQEAYGTYKTRCEVEQEIDVLKTDLDALTSYMQDNDRLEAWMFVNFIALHIFYMIRRRIVEKGLTSKLTTREALRVLCRQRIVRQDKAWRPAEASAKDRALLDALGVSIT